MSPDRKEDQQATVESKIDKVRVRIYRAIAFKGRDELKSLTPDFPEKDSLFPGTLMFEATPEDKKSKARNALNRMLFSVTNQWLDNGLAGGTFDPLSFYARYKSLAKDTSAPNNPGVNPDDRPATAEEIKRMKDRAKKDPSYASFFSWDGIKDLPPFLRRILLADRNYQTMRDVVVPEFKAALAEEGIGKSNRAKALRRFEQLKQEGVPLHEDEKLVGLTREKSKPVPKEQLYNRYRFSEIIRRALEWDELQYIEDEPRRQKRVLDAVNFIVGRGKKIFDKLPIKLNPSISATCVKRDGFRILGYKSQPTSHKARMARLIGTGGHNQMEYILRRHLPPWIIIMEVSTTIGGEPDIIGRMDFLYYDALYGYFQVVDLKFVSSSSFKKVTRDSLPDYMKSTKGVYVAKGPDKRQGLQYLADKRAAGIPVDSADIVYIDLDYKQMRDGIVMWEDNEHEAKELQEKIHKAKLDLEQGKLPQAEVGEHCGYCPYLKDCPEGLDHLVNKRRIPKKRLDPSVRALISKAIREREKQLRGQPLLPLFPEETPSISSKSN